MAQDQTQSLLLTHPDFTASHSRTDSQHSALGPVDIRHQNASLVGYVHSPQINFSPSDLANDSQDPEYRVVNHDELLQLFTEPRPSRIEVGLLHDGRAYAPVTRDQYLLFPSKSNFILYFTHYYFSRENLCKDQTFLSKMTNGYMPLATLVQAPRLRAIQATQEEVADALARSKVVCVEDMGGGVRGVCRRDRGSGVLQSSDEPWTQFVTDGSSATPGVPLYPITRPYPPSAISISTCSLGSASDMDKRPISMPNEFVATGRIPAGGHPTSQNEQSFSVVLPDITDSNSLPVMSENTALCPINDTLSKSTTADYTNSLNPSSAPGTNRTGTFLPNNQAGITPTVPTFGSLPLSQHSLVVDPNSFVLNSPFPLTQNCTAGVPIGNLHTPYELPFVPLRQPGAYGHCVLNSTGAYSFGGYPVSSAGSPVNIAVAAATIPGQQAHLVTGPTFSGSLFSGAATQLTTFNSAPTAALAAYAASQQPPYLQTPVSYNLQTHSHLLQPNVATQAAFPFCYANQPFHFPSHLQRQRFAHAPVYPIPAYPYHSAFLQNPSHVPDFLGNLSKVDSVGLLPSTLAAPHTASNVYPLVLQSHMPLQHTNGLPYNLSQVDARLAMAAAGLSIHRPASSTRNTLNSFGLGCIPVPCAIQPVISEAPLSSDESTTTKNDIPSMCNVDQDTAECGNQLESDHCDLTGANENLDELGNKLALSFTKNVSLGVTLNNMFSNAQVTSSRSDDKPAQHSSADSEDSTSSGIGEMNSACSSSAGDARTLSSFTLTNQSTRLDVSPSKTRRQKIRGIDGLRDAV